VILNLSISVNLAKYNPSKFLKFVRGINSSLIQRNKILLYQYLFDTGLSKIFSFMDFKKSSFEFIQLISEVIFSLCEQDQLLEVIYTSNKYFPTKKMNHFYFLKQCLEQFPSNTKLQTYILREVKTYLKSSSQKLICIGINLLFEVTHNQKISEQNPQLIDQFLQSLKLENYCKYSFWEIKSQVLGLVVSQLIYLKPTQDKNYFLIEKYSDIVKELFNFEQNKLIVRTNFIVLFIN
jgi:hypothetical protein